MLLGHLSFRGTFRKKSKRSPFNQGTVFAFSIHGGPSVRAWTTGDLRCATTAVTPDDLPEAERISDLALT